MSHDLAADVEAAPPQHDGNLYALPRLRADLWNRLRDATRRLDRIGAGENADERLQLKTAIGAMLRRLAPLERYQPFPGEAAIALLLRKHQAGAESDLATMTARLARTY